MFPFTPRSAYQVLLPRYRGECQGEQLTGFQGEQDRRERVR
jgi:hypothetical protein